jgi:hypothetical protein
VGAGVALILIVVITATMASAPAPTGTVITTLPPTGKVIFQDDFTTRTPGWDVGDVQGGGGGYYNGKYRLHLNATNSSVESVPANERSVHPVAPASLRVDVRARLVAARGQAGYGIACRAGDRGGYVFMIWGQDIQIAKDFNDEPWYTTLWDVRADQLDVNVNGENQLQAVCIVGEGQRSVRLVFWVNNHGVEITDTNDPFPVGTVGLVVGTGPDESVESVEAEFDKYVVTQV